LFEVYVVMPGTLAEENQVVKGMPMRAMQVRVCFRVMSKSTRHKPLGFIFPEVVDVVNWYLGLHIQRYPKK